MRLRYTETWKKEPNVPNKSSRIKDLEQLKWDLLTEIPNISSGKTYRFDMSTYYKWHIKDIWLKI